MKAMDRFDNFDPAIQEILCDIGEEVLRATQKHPGWPDDVIHAAAIVSEENGELMRAAVQYELEDGNCAECIKEAIQTGAMTVRFINRFNL